MVQILSIFMFTFGLNGSLVFFTNGNAYLYIYNESNYSKVLLMFYGLTAILCLFVSIYIFYKKQFTNIVPFPNWQEKYNRIPIDVAGVCLFIFGIYALLIVIQLHQLNLFFMIKAIFFNTFITALTLVQIFLLRNRLKDQPSFKEDWKKSFTYRALNGFTDALHISSTGVQVFCLMIVMVCSGIGIPIIVQNRRLAVIYFFLFVIITCPTMLLAAKRIGHFKRLSFNVDRLAKGQMIEDIPVKGWRDLKELTNNINILKHGVSFAQKEMSKSERLKTELITNVSHDLRTPLTSIITYSELLKKEDITDQERESYIEIIDRKSKRLKVLIEDLFEASKMASGAIELNKEKVDLVQLLQQALAENDERIQASPLQFRFKKSDQPIFAVVDGQKLWRVFDNLIGNCIKYSLEQTRVYIDIKKQQGRATISFKNVTKYELSENINELFDRFKRGDESRHTDGSGLGLAIAKSIMDLHGGEMEIEVDGDLFKVTVVIDCAS